jgi:hypothetical protein
MTDLSQTLTVLSAMITPVVLIMASSSLILSTSQRLARSIERTRSLTNSLKELTERTATFEPTLEVTVLFEQLGAASRRARVLQNAMSILYLTLFIFIGSCITIAIISLFFPRHAWIPIVVDMTGVALLFLASIFLLKESRMALHDVHREMDHTLKLFQEKFTRQPTKPVLWKRFMHLLRRP